MRNNRVMVLAGALLASTVLAAFPASAEQAFSDVVRIQPPPQANNQGPLTTVMDESYTPGVQAFAGGNVFIVNRTNGNGNREAIHSEVNVRGGTVGDQIVGLHGAARIFTGEGTAYGLNPYCIVMPQAGSGSQCIGGEINVDLRRDASAKVGTQIVDTSTSTGDGASVSSYLLLTKQTGAAGMRRGIMFGYLDTQSSTATYEDMYPVKAGGTLIYSQPTGRQLAAGMDISKITGNFTDAAIKLKPGDKIRWGDNGIGGEIQSATGSNGPRLLFGDNTLVMRNFAGNDDYLVADANGISGKTFRGVLQTPAQGSACLPGKFVDDANYHYVCTSSNHWKRVALSDF